MRLSDYQLIVINTSGGKDSLVAIGYVLMIAKRQAYPLSNIVLSHQILGRMEWPGATELVQRQAEFFGLRVEFSQRMKDGQPDTILAYTMRRGKWPSSGRRWCTSDFKRTPGDKVVRALSKEFNATMVLQVYGFRAEESKTRAQKQTFCVDKDLTTRSRKVWEWLPIHHFSEALVWRWIKLYRYPYPPSYDLGMSRYSCVFCIMASRSDLAIAATQNPQLLQDYIAVEESTGHTFKHKFSLKQIHHAINHPKSHH